MNYTVHMDTVRNVLILLYGSAYALPSSGKDLLVSFAPTVFNGLRNPAGL